MRAHLVCLVLIVLFSSSGTANTPVDDYQLRDLGGHLHRASDYRGRWLIINFWATWCAPCLHEMPELQRFHDDNRGRAAVWGVTFEDGDRATILEFVERLEITYPILGFDQDPQTGYGAVNVLPTTFVIDPNGVLHRRYEGPITAAHLEQATSGK